jgi:signal transduction histidine kinase
MRAQVEHTADMWLWRWAHARRTSIVVTLGTLVAVAAVYVVVVLGGGVLIGRTDSPSVGLCVLATALVALGLEPWRRRLRSVVIQRLDHGRRSPYDVLSGFIESLTEVGGDGAVPTDLVTRLARQLATGTGASWAQVWLSVGGTLEPAATWPPGADVGSSVPTGSVPTGAVPSGPVPTGRVHTRDVLLDGEHLGTLRVCERADAPFGPIEERLVSDLATQAGMVLHRARLRAELARRATDLAFRADELQESRRRLVDAQDVERRRLERDIHDGAQQHLVALVVNLRLAQTLTGRAPDRARAVLAEQVDAVDAAIATLLDLSRGLYPRALTEHGVGAALRLALAGTSVPIVVEDEGLARLPEEIEAALYFCAVEAVQNAVKHAEASAITVSLSSDALRARLEVHDDGRGFEPSADGGHGLGNMRDRIDAVRGRFALQSDAGHGATIVATVPLQVEVAS